MFHFLELKRDMGRKDSKRIISSSIVPGWWPMTNLTHISWYMVYNHWKKSYTCPQIHKKIIGNIFSMGITKSPWFSIPSHGPWRLDDLGYLHDEMETFISVDSWNWGSSDRLLTRGCGIDEICYLYPFRSLHCSICVPMYSNHAEMLVAWNQLELQSCCNHMIVVPLRDYSG